jgi:simple sugar transport system permease protein
MIKQHFGVKILNSTLPVIFAFLIGGIIILALGENPIQAYRIMLGRSLFTVRGLGNTLHYASPLILTGLAVAITFKSKIFNMGVEGQLLFGGFFAGIVGAYLSIDVPFLHKLICFAVAMLCGPCCPRF